jgi:hypothetical protein
VHDGENGYLFEPGNVDDLADKLRRVLTASPEEYLRMQQASLDGVEIHDIEKTLDTFEKLYRGEPLERLTCACSSTRGTSAPTSTTASAVLGRAAAASRRRRAVSRSSS